MAKRSNGSGSRQNRIIGRRYRYTSDYRIVPGLGRNGRTEKSVLYVADWIVPANEAGEYRRIVLWQRLLLAAAALALLGAMTVIPPPMDNKWYVPVLVTSLFPLAYQLLAVGFIPAEPKPLERERYEKGIVRMGRGAMGVFVIVCLSALGCAVYWLIASLGSVEGSAPYSLRDGAFALLLVLAAVSEQLIYRQFRRIRTETRKNTALTED